MVADNKSSCEDLSLLTLSALSENLTSLEPNCLLQGYTVVQGTVSSSSNWIPVCLSSLLPSTSFNKALRVVLLIFNLDRVMALFNILFPLASCLTQSKSLSFKNGL